jgi:hypothetical protein
LRVWIIFVVLLSYGVFRIEKGLSDEWLQMFDVNVPVPK